MKLIRKLAEVPSAPKPTPQVEPPSDPGVHAAADAIVEIAVAARGAFAEMVQTSRAVAEKLKEPRQSDPKPTSFRCTVTERDARGRIKSMDIEVKG